MPKNKSMKIKTIFTAIFLSATQFIFAQQFECKTTKPVNYPWYFFVNYIAYSTENTNYYYGINNYDYWGEYTIISKTYFGKKDKNWYVIPVNKQTNTPSPAFVFNIYYNDIDGKTERSISRCIPYKSTIDSVVWYGIGTYQMNQYWLFEKKIHPNGEVFQEWSPKVYLGMIPDSKDQQDFRECSKDGENLNLYIYQYNKEMTNRTDYYKLTPTLKFIHKLSITMPALTVDDRTVFSSAIENNKQYFCVKNDMNESFIFRTWDYDSNAEVMENKLIISTNGKGINSYETSYDQVKKQLTIVGAYRNDKLKNKLLSDGLFCIKVDLPASKIISEVFSPFEPTFGKDNNPRAGTYGKRTDQQFFSLLPLRTHAFPDGTVLLHFCSYNDYPRAEGGQMGALFNPEGQVKKVFFIGGKNDKLDEMRQGKYADMFLHKGKPVFIVKGNVGDLTSTTFKEAGKGPEALLWIAVDSEGNREVKEIFQYKARKDLKNLRPRYIKKFENNEFYFRFRPDTDEYQFGSIKVID